MVLLAPRMAKVSVLGLDTVTPVSKEAMVATESPLTVTDRSQGSTAAVRLQRGVLRGNRPSLLHAKDAHRRS